MSFLSAFHASAAFVLLDDFSDGDSAGWVASENNGDSVQSDGGNNYLQVNIGDGQFFNLVEYNLAGNSISNGSTATVFMRIRTESTANAAWQVNSVSGLGGREAQFGYDVGRTPPTYVRDDDTGRDSDQALASDTWYNVWYLLDTTGDGTPGNEDSYSMYIQGGAYTSQTQITSGSGSLSDFLFRNSADTGLTHLALTSSTAGNMDVDDVYIDTTGFNTVNPIPEPGTLVLLGLAGTAAGLSFLRLRR